MSSCAFGQPLLPTHPRTDGITLNAAVHSSIAGPTDAWFVYGQPGDYANWQETTHKTVQIVYPGGTPGGLSQSITGLNASTVYGWKVCVADRERPPRTVSSKDSVFATVGDSVGLSE